jgi:L-lactate dehydrogenase (cytochrome)
MSGRAYIYGLGAAGEAGVARAIEIMRNELDITMALIGVDRVADINRGAIVDWPARQPYEKV